MTCSSPLGSIRSTTRWSRPKWGLLTTVVSTRTSGWSGKRPTSLNRSVSSLGLSQSILPSYCFGAPGLSSAGRCRGTEGSRPNGESDEISFKVGHSVEDLLLRIEAASDPIGHSQIGNLVVQIDNLLKVKVQAGGEYSFSSPFGRSEGVCVASILKAHRLEVATIPRTDTSRPFRLARQR